MARRPLISIIVPVHRTEATLGACLDSLLRQTLDRLEIIVIDDASPDNAGDIISHYAAMDPRICSFRNTPNQGLYTTRRIGFNAARGRYLAVCDSDDAMPPDGLEALYHHAQSTGADIVHGRTRKLAARKPGKVLWVAEPFSSTNGMEYAMSMLRNRRSWNMWAKLYRRRLWLRAASSLPEEKPWFVAEDMAYSFALALHAKRYAHTRRTVYHYRMPEGNRFADPRSAVRAASSQVEILAFLRNLCSSRSVPRELPHLMEEFIAHISGSILLHAPQEPEVRREVLAQVQRVLGTGRPVITTNGGWRRLVVQVLSRVARGDAGELRIDFNRFVEAAGRRGLRRLLEDLRTLSEGVCLGGGTGRKDGTA